MLLTAPRRRRPWKAPGPRTSTTGTPLARHARSRRRSAATADDEDHDEEEEEEEEEEEGSFTVAAVVVVAVAAAAIPPSVEYAWYSAMICSGSEVAISHFG